MQRDAIALIEKGIPFERKNFDLTNRTPEFIELYTSMCPDTDATAKVPILEHGERGSNDYVRIIDSPVILEYIEDVWGDVGVRLRPTDPKDAAAVRMFNESFNKMQPWGLLKAENQKELQEELGEYVKGMRIVDRCLQLYKKRDAAGDLLMGTNWSQAECMAAPILVRSAAWLKDIRGVELIKLAKDLGLQLLAKWMETVLSRASVAKTIPPVDLSENIIKVHPEWIKCMDKINFTVTAGEVVPKSRL